jgi:hypothetical protein
MWDPNVPRMNSAHMASWKTENVFETVLARSWNDMANIRIGRGTVLKVVPLQARCGPQGSRRLRLPDFHDIRHMKVVRSSALRTGRLYPQECSWYSFSQGAESTPGPWYGRKEYVTEKSSDTTGNRSRDRPTSSAAPLPLCYPRPPPCWKVILKFLNYLSCFYLLKASTRSCSMYILCP